MEADERKLVDDARRGEMGAFRVLVERYQRKAYAVALGMVHDPDEARDICQDAFLRAHRNLASFEGDAQFFTWLYRIVANLCIDHLRKRRGDRPVTGWPSATRPPSVPTPSPCPTAP